MVRIVTDSASDIPAKVAEELEITVVPLYVRFGNEVYRDGIELNTKDFYRKLTTSQTIPTTSAPTTRDFCEVYDRLAEETSEILSIHLSSKFSRVCQAALRGKERTGRKCRVEIIDSLTGAMGEGLIVITAAKEAQRGVHLDQIADTIRKAIPKAHVYVCFETLEYLKMGGRIGRAQPLLGSALKVNPIVALENGEIQPLCRERSRAKAIERLYNFAKRFANITSLAVEHGAAPEEAETLVLRLRASSPKEPIYVSTVGCAVGAHTGPHVIGVSILET